MTSSQPGARRDQDLEPSSERRARSRRARWRALRRDLLSMGVMVTLLLVGRSTLADHYRVPSGSMEPTVHVGDRVVVDKSAYGLRVPFSEAWLSGVRTPQRGDVVVVRSPEDDRVLLKRVVATAGDVVSVRDGRLILNGEPAPLSAAPTPAAATAPADDGRPLPNRERLDAGVHPVRLGAGGPDYGPRRVSPGHLLLMGDNRGNSHDSRSFGEVRLEALLGQAVAVYARDGELVWIEL